MTVVGEINALVEEIEAYDESDRVEKWLGKTEIAVDTDKAFEAITKHLPDMLPPTGTNLGFPPSTYYGDKEYPMPGVQDILAAAVRAESQEYHNGSGLRWLAIYLRLTDAMSFKIGVEISHGIYGDWSEPYVYDRVWISSYAETGYEDGHTYQEGQRSTQKAEQFIQTIQEVLKEEIVEA